VNGIECVGLVKPARAVNSDFYPAIASIASRPLTPMLAG
jgi:hypothetical protein